MKTIYILILLLCFGCGDADFKKVESLNEFRILGIQASNSEVAPGDTVTLQLVVSDPTGGGRTINGTTQACIDPGVAVGASVNCDHDPSTVNGTYSINTTGLDLFTGLVPDTESITVPATIFTGRSEREKFNGVAYMVIFNFTVDGSNVKTFKRVVANNQGRINNNPTGSTILLNGSPAVTTPNDGDALTVTSSAPETYTFHNIDGSIETRTEDFQVAWYVTQGNFDKPKSDIGDTVKYQGTQPTDPSLIMAVIRDERGGLDFVIEYFP